MAEIVRARLTSGPDEAVHREVDLTEYSIFTIQNPAVFDASVRTLDGTEKIYSRRRRKSFVLEIDALTPAELRVLEQMCSDRQELCFEANIGQHTVVYAPFERSADGYICDATYARDSVATYQDSDGIIREVAIDAPRFEAGKIGKGILLEPEITNYCFPSHPATGALLYAAADGAPTLAWDANMASNIEGHNGTLRVEGDSGESVSTDVTFPDTTACSVFVWVKGSGTLTLYVTGLATAKSMAVVPLTGDWQKLYIHGGESDGVVVTVKLGIGADDTIFWVSGTQVEDYMTGTSYMPAETQAETREMDTLSFAPAAFNYGQGSISFWMRYPSIITGCPARYLFRATAEFYCTITDAGVINFRLAAGAGNVASVAAATHGLATGDWAHIACVWKRDYFALIVNGVALASGTSNVRDTGPPTAINLNGIAVTTRSPHTVIDDFRVDTQYVEWRLNQGGEFEKYEQDGNVELITQTQGRLFRIQNISFRPREGAANVLDGQIVLAESSSGALHTVGSP